MTDSIDKRFDDLIRDFDVLLGHPKNKTEQEADTLDTLLRYGLTMDEAKGWLEN
jgi:hypothetical protein